MAVWFSSCEAVGGVMPSLLAYWNFAEKVTPIRLLLSYVEEEYTYKEYKVKNHEQWYKGDKIQLEKTFDFPNLPYYIDGQVHLTQTKTILAYLGKKYNLGAKNENEKIRISLAMEQAFDMRVAICKLGYPPEHAENPLEIYETLRREYLESLPARLSLFSKFIGSNDWVVGDRLTYADFFVYAVLDSNRIIYNEKHFNAFPNLVSYAQRIESLKGIKKFLANVKKLPIYAPGYALCGSSLDYKPSD